MRKTLYQRSVQKYSLLRVPAAMVPSIGCLTSSAKKASRTIREPSRASSRARQVRCGRPPCLSERTVISSECFISDVGRTQLFFKVFLFQHVEENVFQVRRSQEHAAAL